MGTPCLPFRQWFQVHCSQGNQSNPQNIGNNQINIPNYGFLLNMNPPQNQNGNNMHAMYNPMQNNFQMPNQIPNQNLINNQFNNNFNNINQNQKETEPIQTYKKPTLIGLNNIGSTCYKNAVLQCLSQTEGLTNYFLNQKFYDRIMNNNIVIRRYYGSFECLLLLRCKCASLVCRTCL